MIKNGCEIIVHSGKTQALAGFRVEIADTEENRQKVGKMVQELTKAITRDKANIAFGVGLRDGKVVMEAENLDLALRTRSRQRNCWPFSRK